MFSRSMRIVLFATASFMASSSLRADVTGSILGVVRDATQAVVTGARIVATNTETNLNRETTSAVDGSYRILALPAGTYKVTVTASGFQQYTTTDIDVKVNDHRQPPFFLTVIPAAPDPVLESGSFHL